MDTFLSPIVTGFLVFEWILRFVMLFVVPHRRKPSSANAWLLLIMIVPTLGVILFYMFGNPKLPMVRRIQRRKVDRMTEKELVELRRKHKKLFARLANDDHQTLARLASVLGGLPAMHGNEVSIVDDYEQVYKELVASFDNAKEYIHVEFFIVALDETTLPVFESLQRAAGRGVKVRFLYDKIVSRRYPNRKKLYRMLDSIGIEHREMLPLSLIPGKNFTRPDLRNHRKIVVVDGMIAFTGSQNLIDKSYHRKDDLYYEEVMMKLTGPIVWQYNNVFRADWFAETEEPLLELVEDNDIPASTGSVIAQVLPSGPAHDHGNNLKFYTSMVHSAKERVGIVVPYFIPDESFLDALIAAAQRGVKVTIINSESIDKLLAGHAQRSYYEEMLEAGIQIYLYKEPVFLHTKQVLIDNEVAIVGSSNLDIRSFELDLEVTTILYDTQVVKKLQLIESRYIARSIKISLRSWRARPTKYKMLDSISRLTAALQ